MASFLTRIIIPLRQSKEDVGMIIANKDLPDSSISKKINKIETITQIAIANT